MGRTLSDVIASLPAERRATIQSRYDELRGEVEGLRELRSIAGKAQADVAKALGIRQPSVSKIEQQSDIYLSTLRGYIEALGGHLDLVVRLPDRPAIHLQTLGDLTAGRKRSTGRVLHRATGTAAATPRRSVRKDLAPA